MVGAAYCIARRTSHFDDVEIQDLDAENGDNFEMLVKDAATAIGVLNVLYRLFVRLFACLPVFVFVFVYLFACLLAYLFVPSQPNTQTQTPRHRATSVHASNVHENAHENTRAVHMRLTHKETPT